MAIKRRTCIWILQQWQEADFPLFAELNADKQVMKRIGLINTNQNFHGYEDLFEELVGNKDM